LIGRPWLVVAYRTRFLRFGTASHHLDVLLRLRPVSLLAPCQGCLSNAAWPLTASLPASPAPGHLQRSQTCQLTPTCQARQLLACGQTASSPVSGTSLCTTILDPSTLTQVCPLAKPPVCWTFFVSCPGVTSTRPQAREIDPRHLSSSSIRHDSGRQPHLQFLRQTWPRSGRSRLCNGTKWIRALGCGFLTLPPLIVPSSTYLRPPTHHQRRADPSHSQRTTRVARGRAILSVPTLPSTAYPSSASCLSNTPSSWGRGSTLFTCPCASAVPALSTRGLSLPAPFDRERGSFRGKARPRPGRHTEWTRMSWSPCTNS
jgi:hypothetical protein